MVHTSGQLNMDVAFAVLLSAVGYRKGEDTVGLGKNRDRIASIFTHLFFLLGVITTSLFFGM